LLKYFYNQSSHYNNLSVRLFHEKNSGVRGEEQLIGMNPVLQLFMEIKRAVGKNFVVK